MDDVSTTPITSDRCVESAALSGRSSKPGGGSTEGRIGGCLRSMSGTGYGMLFAIERVMSRP